MKADWNQSSLLPSSSSVCSAERPTAMVRMPNQSPSFSRPNCIGARSSVNQRATIISALGTVLMKKMVCQP